MLNPQQQFEQDLRKELEAIDFPAELIPVNFINSLDTALVNESMESIACDYKSLVKLYAFAQGKGETTNMFIMGTAINAVEKQSYKTYQGLDYLTIIGNAVTMGVKWNEIVLPIQEKLQRKMQALANAPKQQHKKLISLR